MNDGLRKAQRLLAVQSALDRLAEWAWIGLDSEAALLQERRRDLVRLLDGEMIPPLSPGLMMRHLQALAQRQAAVAAEKDARAERWRQERARLRMAERIVEAKMADAARIAEARHLADVIEADVERQRVRQRQG